MKYVLPVVAGMGTPGFWKIIIDHIPLEVLQSARHFVLEMDRSSKEIYEEKKRALAEGDETLTKQVAGGKDLISLLSKFYTTFVLWAVRVGSSHGTILQCAQI